MLPSLISQLTSQKTPVLAEPSQSNISNGTAELLCLVSLLFLAALVTWMVIRSRAASKRGTTGEASVGTEDSDGDEPRGQGRGGSPP